MQVSAVLRVVFINRKVLIFHNHPLQFWKNKTTESQKNRYNLTFTWVNFSHLYVYSIYSYRTWQLRGVWMWLVTSMPSGSRFTVAPTVSTSTPRTPSELSTDMMPRGARLWVHLTDLTKCLTVLNTVWCILGWFYRLMLPLLSLNFD